MKRVIIIIFIIATLFFMIGCKHEKTNSIKNIELTKVEGLEHTYTITYSDGTTSEIVVKNGEKGDQGETGVSIVNAYIDEKYHLILILSNGSTIDAGYVGVEISTNTKNYTVVFKDYDGRELKSVKVDEGKDATAPQPPYKEGYEFIGWDVDFTNIKSDLVVTAQYKKIVSEVNVFDINYVDNNNGTFTATIYITGSTIKYSGLEGYLLFDSSKLTLISTKKLTGLSGIINGVQDDSKVYIALAGNDNITESEDIFSVTFSFENPLNTSLSLIIEDIFDENFETQEFSTIERQIGIN